MLALGLKYISEIRFVNVNIALTGVKINKLFVQNISIFFSSKVQDNHLEEAFNAHSMFHSIILFLNLALFKIISRC